MSDRVFYNKLVRDGVIEKLKRFDLDPEYRILKPHEVPREALRKLVEETHEVLRAYDQGKASPHAHRSAVEEELADIYTAFLKTMDAFGVTKAMLERVEREKRNKKHVGGFKENMFLVSALAEK